MNNLRHKNKLHLMVERCLGELGLLDKSSSIVVAVSGGPDSLSLMLLLNEIRLEHGFKLCAAHLDHSLRKESSSEAKYVSKTGSDLGIPVILDRKDVRLHSKKYGLSIEEAARNIRYDFLSNTARINGANAIAVGHTSDDQVETILMHLIRGSGIAGLTGMGQNSYWPSKTSTNKIAIVRPLLNASHQETQEYCAHMGFIPINDLSNLSDEFTRNSIRLNLLPLLQRYNPKVKESILRLAHSVSQDQSFILSETNKAKYRITEQTNTGFSVDRTKFQSMPYSLRNSLLRVLYHEISGTYSRLTNRHLQSMLYLASGNSGKMLNLPGHIIFSVEYSRISIDLVKSAQTDIQDKSIEHPLRIPGETVLPNWIAISNINNQPVHTSNEIQNIANLDIDKIGNNLRFRTRQKGDVFQPLGMTGHKNLGEFLTDSKVPRHLRDKIPLLASDLGIAWVIGTRIANWAKVTPTTTNVLTVSLSMKT